MRKKRHAPIKQLRAAAKYANEMLAKRGVQSKDSRIEQIKKDANAPILPGIPSYIPHRWTIQAAQKGMYALLNEWLSDHIGKDEKVTENVSNFFAFVVRRMEEEEKKWKAEMKKVEKTIKQLDDVPVLSDIFSSVRKRETAHALNAFFVDSFAVSVIVHQNDCVSSYADWFLNEWTPALYKLWPRFSADDKKEDDTTTPKE